jgi:HPt (histidine-containing phosphotransfer) domain-containing protein
MTDRTNDQTGDPIDAATVARLLDSVGGDASFVDELVDAYLGDAPVHLTAIGTAIAAGSSEDLVRPAHTLKSSSATVGALGLSAVARELELNARAGSLDGAAERHATATAEYARVTDSLATWRAASWQMTED